MTATAEPMITFDHVQKAFGARQAVRELDFTIVRGELVSVVGVTGCGKSTMFNLALGLFPPTAGLVRVQGHDPCSEFDWFRQKVAVVFQDARLLPWRSVLDNVCVGMKFAGLPKSSWRETAEHWLSRLGLADRGDAYPHELSGGQRQRVSLARAFAVDPELILCDESFSALDEITSEALRAEFVELVREGGKTGVVITHSLNEALSLGNRILVMRPPGHLADDIRLPSDPSADTLEQIRARVLAAMTPERRPSEIDA